MYELKVAWYEVTTSYVRIKFVPNVSPTTLINDNFVVVTDDATPQVIVDPFHSLDLARDFDSISRIITLWWQIELPADGYYLEVNGLKDHLGFDIDPFEIPFTVDGESATPSVQPIEERPSRDPVDVEDYSLKHPTWSIEQATTLIEDSSGELDIVDIQPKARNAYQIEPRYNNGIIRIMFNYPILANYINPIYFVLTEKKAGIGVSKWETVDTRVLPNEDSTIIEIYLPTTNDIGETIYSYYMDADEGSEKEYFKVGYKYRLVISSAVGA